MKSITESAWAACCFAFALATPVFGTGAIAYKSGPIQITADGQFVWAVNPDHDSVSRLKTSDRSVVEFPLPPSNVKHRPRGFAITPNGAEVWVAASESDQVFVLSSATGQVTSTIPLPWGSAPTFVAISQDGKLAVVTLYRSASVAMCSATNHSVTKILDHLWPKPFAVAFVSTANRVWVTHTMLDGEHSFATAIDTASMSVASRVFIAAPQPHNTTDIPSDPDPIPEGGYIFLTSQVAQRPGTNLLWMPVQYQNFHTTVFTPNSSIQSAVHRINLDTVSTNPDDRVVLTAVYAHSNSNVLLGAGWNAGVSGPADIAFNTSGSTAYIVHAYSNDVVVLPSTTTKNRPTGSPALTEIAVGDNPIGIAISPVAETAYVLNYLSRDVSVLDLTSQTQIARVPITPTTPEPLTAQVLTGAKIFNSSVDPRASSNQKISCASCHFQGDTDTLQWNFAQLGAGQRKTLHMRGLSLSFAPQTNGLGQLHRSGDRDEVQDFDLTFKAAIMGGSGFAPGLNPALGAPNAGLSPELDALAAYLLSLPAVPRSPYRKSDGLLSEDALRGAAIYKNTVANSKYNVGCNSCHPAPNFTDLGFHGVGGSAPAPEHQGPAFNTPSLVSAFAEGPYRQGMGQTSTAATNGMVLGDMLRVAKAGVHGNTTGLDATQMRDVEVFLNSIDGDMAAAGIGAVADHDPPRVISVQPLSLSAVEVVFNESVDPATAGNPTNYVFNDGRHNIAATAAAVNSTLGNHVRVSVPLHYFGNQTACPVTYMLVPGPIQDLAGTISGGANNVLDVNDASNRKTFNFDNGITVTFGNVGGETFPAVAHDASFEATSSATSYTHVKLSPATSPEQKGFVWFDYVSTLKTACGLTNSSRIIDARFSGLADYGNRNTLEARRCLMPWGEPPRDFCSGCTGTVTRSYATYSTIPWHQTGAAAMGGAGTSASEYYPTGTFDIAGAVDATTGMTGLTDRVWFSGPGVVDAFRFWFDNPTKNFGYCVEISGNISNTGLDFLPDEPDDGRGGWTLSLTLSVPISPPPAGDLDCDGDVDSEDLDAFTPCLSGAGVPEIAGCATADLDGDGDVDMDDFGMLQRCTSGADALPVTGCER